ncbi:sulfurtransferase complex subunit TusC [Oceanicoccus sp. KOV_DT_Chl]|uniref:sulfurtransferase complex subunit TusC n=1 Tax=Oceanicoccus sp. KOV_DT_Chl TaxID=1904639 RepID=UPI001356A5F5|nr:sulfurtransferase complex subunit TusC [Oceanicoccus sp. KOV_DT_Chl]
MEKKHLLLVCRKAPYGNALSREAIDIALAAAVFDQQLSLLFTGDGVLQLLDQQQPEDLGLKSQQKLLSALELYDINNLFVDTDALTARHINEADLFIATKPLDQSGMSALLLQADIILNF